MKACNKCGETLEEGNFYKSSRYRGGLGYYCKNCMKAAQKEYYAKNKEKYRKAYREGKEYWKIRGKKNEEEIKEGRRRYYEKNRERISEYNGEYYGKNRARIRERRKAVYRKKKEMKADG